MSKKIIAITSCPVGVAHTYMAAENLEKAGKELGVAIKVETHGSIGIENQLTQEDIQEAEGLIIAADTDIDKSRFAGKQIIEVGVKEGISRPHDLIHQILDQKGQRLSSTTSKYSSPESQKNTGNSIYRSLMNGVSFMVPFVVTGGLLIAIALTLGGTPTEKGFVVPEGTFWSNVLNIGGAAMMFMNPILAGYIAYGIADRPGLVPGMIGGYIASNGSFYNSEANTGFIGAIIAGFLAGYIAKSIKKIRVPKAIESVMPIIFIPILSTLAVGITFTYLLGAPVANLFTALTHWLTSMQGSSTIILAAIIGAMIAVDMGGPFNKTAFLFGTGLIAEGQYAVMGAVAVAVCIPPIAVGVASHMFKNKFTDADRQAGTAAAAMGFFGITEGAIPFAAKDPIAIIPSIVIGTSIGSIVGMLSGVGGHVAHGGPIVALLGAIDNVIMFFVAVAIGVASTVFLIGLFKKNLESAPTTSPYPKHSDPIEKVESSSPHEADASEDSLALTDLTGPNFYHLNLSSSTKEEVFEELLSNPNLKHRISDPSFVLDAVKQRETEGSTGMGDGIAIPHAKSSAVLTPTVLFGRSQGGIEWQSLDNQPAHMIFLILVPEAHQGTLHLKILQLLARKLMDQQFKQALLAAQSKEDIHRLFEEINNH